MTRSGSRWLDRSTAPSTTAARAAQAKAAVAGRSSSAMTPPASRPANRAVITAMRAAGRPRRLVARGQPGGDPRQPRAGHERDDEHGAEQRRPGQVHGARRQRAPTAASRALRMAAIGAGCPVMSSTWTVACQNSTSSPPTTVPPTVVTRSASGVGHGE